MFRQQKAFCKAILMGMLIAFGWSTLPAQAAPSSAQVGYVDFIYLIDHHPDTAKANAILKAEQEAAQKEFAEKSAGLDAKSKQDLDRQLGQQLERKRIELLQPIADKVTAATNEVREAQGLSIVIGKREVVCGGVDITAEVLKKITG